MHNLHGPGVLSDCFLSLIFQYISCHFCHLFSCSYRLSVSHLLLLSLLLQITVHLPTGAFVCPRDTMHPHATEPQSNSTHSSFRVLIFRDWFGVQTIERTFKILLSTFKVRKFRDWSRVSCFKCTLKGILHSGANEGAWPYIYILYTSYLRLREERFRRLWTAYPTSKRRCRQAFSFQIYTV